MINLFAIMNSAVTLTSQSQMIRIVGYIIVLIILFNILLRLYCYNIDLKRIIREWIRSIQESRRDIDKHLG